MQNTLNQWLNGQPKGRSKELAEYLGISESHMSQARVGKRKIRVPWMEAIEKFTKGQVTVMQMVRDVANNEKTERSKR
jgi:DNA-binding transcriptional regulator YdaS (Cro superfamily)